VSSFEVKSVTLISGAKNITFECPHVAGEKTRRWYRATTHRDDVEDKDLTLLTYSLSADDQYWLSDAVGFLGNPTGGLVLIQADVWAAGIYGCYTGVRTHHISLVVLG